MSGGIGTKEILTDYPYTSGINEGERHWKRKKNLVALKGSICPKRLKVGL